MDLGIAEYKKAQEQLQLRSEALQLVWQLASQSPHAAAAPTQQATAAFLVGRSGSAAARAPKSLGRTLIRVVTV